MSVAPFALKDLSGKMPPPKHGEREAEGVQPRAEIGNDTSKSGNRTARHVYRSSKRVKWMTERV
jgi:hypothetical protein